MSALPALAAGSSRLRWPTKKKFRFPRARDPEATRARRNKRVAASRSCLSESSGRVGALDKIGFIIIRQGKHITMSDGVRTIQIPRADPVNAYTMDNIAKQWPHRMSSVSCYKVKVSRSRSTGVTTRGRALRKKQKRPIGVSSGAL
jgi:hypothetical protein